MRSTVVAIGAAALALSASASATADSHGDGPYVTSAPTKFTVTNQSSKPGDAPPPGSLPAPTSPHNGAAEPPVDPNSCGGGRLLHCYPTVDCAIGDSQDTVLVTLHNAPAEPNGSGALPSCDPPSDGPALDALVLRAFREVPLPAPVLDIQPPKGKTLIGLETIFSTSAPSFTRQLTLLGQQVELRIEASGFTWHHGDETTQTTAWSGIAWRKGLSMDRYITHVYEQTGAVQPSVEVTWSAEYRVNNGPWQPVNGTVTRAGAPQNLEILEAEPRLVTG